MAEFPYEFDFRVRLYRKEYPGQTFQRSLTIQGDNEAVARRLLIETAHADGYFIKEVIGVEKSEI